MSRKNLVIVRAGDSSLHPRWLRGEASDWDLIVSYFGDDPDKYRDPSVVRIDGKGPKWPALQDVIEAHQEMVRGYDAVWLPDDDLDCTAADINRLFEIFEREDLRLAQPSLTADSYFSHPITLHNPCFRLRCTSFVEIMAPLMTRDTLFRLLPTFSENLTGWGLDYVWPALLPGDGSDIAVIDDVQVRHTRPIGAANYGALKAGGMNAWDHELPQLLERYGIRERRAFIRTAVPRLGSRRIVRAGVELTALHAMGLLASAPLARGGFFPFLHGWMSAVYQQVRPPLPPVRPVQTPSE